MHRDTGRPEHRPTGIPKSLNIEKQKTGTDRDMGRPRLGRESMPSSDRIPETVNTGMLEERNTEKPDTEAMESVSVHELCHSRNRESRMDKYDPPMKPSPASNVPASWPDASESHLDRRLRFAFPALEERWRADRSNARTRDGAARGTCRMPCSPVAHTYQDGPGRSTWSTVRSTA